MHGDSKPLRKWRVHDVGDGGLTIHTDDQEGFQMVQECCQVVQPHFVTPYSECFTSAPSYPLMYQSAMGSLGQTMMPPAAPAIAVSPNFYIGSNPVQAADVREGKDVVQFGEYAPSISAAPETNDLKQVTSITKVG